MAGNGYGREAPEGIPQSVWDRAVEEWRNATTTMDSNRIRRIAKRIMREERAKAGAQ